MHTAAAKAAAAQSPTYPPLTVVRHTDAVVVPGMITVCVIIVCMVVCVLLLAGGSRCRGWAGSGVRLCACGCGGGGGCGQSPTRRHLTVARHADAVVMPGMIVVVVMCVLFLAGDSRCRGGREAACALHAAAAAAAASPQPAGTPRGSPLPATLTPWSCPA